LDKKRKNGEERVVKRRENIKANTIDKKRIRVNYRIL
jgi:hypothetical protein